jgi:hypothetical protein
MNLQDLFKNLSYGVLSNLALSNDGAGTIREKDEGRVLLAINEALLRIYSRFNLREKTVFIAQQEGVTSYNLTRKYAVTAGLVPRPYILDLGEDPFEEDVIKILAVYNSVGWQMPLNDNEAPYSLFTPQATVLQIPNPNEQMAVAVLYQARHRVIEQGDMEAAIELPSVLEGALYAHVAYQVYDSIGTLESVARAQNHLMNYEQICVDLLASDSVQTSISTSNGVFEKRGWI